MKEPLYDQHFRERYYTLKAETFKRLKFRLSLHGVKEDDTDIALYLDRAADYAEAHPKFWQGKTDPHFINSLVWKALKVYQDSAKQSGKLLSMNVLMQGEANEDEVLSKVVWNSSIGADEIISLEELCLREEVLEAIFQTMSPTSRRCCELFYLRGYTREEIADELGMKYAAVTKAIQRGIEAAKTSKDTIKKLIEE